MRLHRASALGPPPREPRAKTREISEGESLPDAAAWGEPGAEGGAVAEEDWGTDWQEDAAAQADQVDVAEDLAMESPEPLPEAPAPVRQPRESSGGRGQRDDPAHALRTVHERLARSVDLRNPAMKDMSEDQLRSQTAQAVQGIVANMQATGEIPVEMQPSALMNMALDEAVGFGPLDELLQDPTVTEILVNNARQIFVERAGQLEPSGVHSLAIRQCSTSSKKLWRLWAATSTSAPPWWTRVCAMVHASTPSSRPYPIRGPTLTIRKFAREPLQIDDLVAGGSLNADMAEFFEVCVQARKNVIISGGTGSGKTTLLNVLSSFVDSSERILTNRRCR